MIPPRMRIFGLVSLLPALCLWTGCAGDQKGGESSGGTAGDSPFGASGIPPQLRPKRPEPGGAPTVLTPPEGGGPLFTPEDEIVFTDPDNPDASLPELSSILTTAPKKRGPWEESETIAKKRAAREGKPLLIWFTDSARSPLCKALEQEVFNRPDFKKWASDRVVRLRIDTNIATSEYVNDPDISLGEKESRRVEVINYAKRLKKQYKALGHPFVITLHPNGGVIGRYPGYSRGQSDFYWGRLKQDVEVSTLAHQEWRGKLEQKGYREWNDRHDRSIFAKLAGYKDGTLILIEPDGTRCKTHESKLAKEDRDWIDEQKRRRGM